MPSVKADMDPGVSGVLLDCVHKRVIEASGENKIPRRWQVQILSLLSFSSPMPRRSSITGGFRHASEHDTDDPLSLALAPPEGGAQHACVMYMLF